MAISLKSRFNYSDMRFSGYRYRCITLYRSRQITHPPVGISIRLGHEDRKGPFICHVGDPFSAFPLPDPVRRYLTSELGLSDDRAGSGNVVLSDPAPLIDLMHRILHFGMSCGYDDVPDWCSRTGVMVIKGPACSARSLAYLVPAMEKVGGLNMMILTTCTHECPQIP